MESTHTGHPDRGLKPGVSAVVCCYNSAEIIVPTIESLSRQEVPPGIGYEVILVDNNCTDNTVRLAKDTWRDIPYPLRIVKEKEPGLIYARKTGVKNAEYDILLFIDDDNILNPDWVAKLYRLYGEMPDVGMIGGYNEALIQGDKPRWFDRYQFAYACGPRAKEPGLNPKKLFGAGLSFRTEAAKSVLFSDLPFFLVGRTGDILMRGEDTEMALRCRLMGWDSYYDSSLRLRHNLLPGRLTWNYLCRTRKGDGAASIILRMYRDLAENRELRSFSRLVRIVLEEWKTFFTKHKRYIFYIKTQGLDSSAFFYRLWGVTLGLFLYRKSYENIQASIMDYFSRNSKRAGDSF